MSNELSNVLFIAGTTIFFGFLLRWGFKALPDKKWQFLAVLPCKPSIAGSWSGVNITYYGLFNALAHVIALSVLLILTGAVGVSVDKILMILVIVMCICIPASRLLAGWIEKKRHTFTVGGASFVGIVLAPVAVWFVYYTIYPGTLIPFLPVLAAMAIAYAIGEGVGRLACISFGCCYGKPVADSHPILQRIFNSRAFVFTGATKKIAYEGKLDGQKVLPVQAVTSIILIGTAIFGTYLFLLGLYRQAFVLVVIVTQGWRLLSEMFRADYRGSETKCGRYTKFSFSASVYQILAILAVGYAMILWLFLPDAAAAADIGSGIRSLWDPGVILFLQAWGAGIFWYTGRSRVTGSYISFQINKERI
jgi:hypothetical protein